MKSTQLFWVLVFFGNIIWIIILGILTFEIPIQQSTYLFFDYLHNQDVTSQYVIEASGWNDFFDPPIQFLQRILLGDNGFLIIFGGYFLARMLFWWKKKLHGEEYPQVLFRSEKLLNIFGGFFLYFILGLLLFVFGGLIIAGPLVVIIYGFSIIQAIAVGLNLVVIGLILIEIILYFIPNSGIGKKIQQFITYWVNRPQKKFYRYFNQHIKLRRLVKEIKRVGLLGLVYGFLLLTSYILPVPVNTIQTDLASNEFLFDFHVHTCRSDGWPTPAQRVEWYRSHGIHGAAFSDHHSINGAMEAQAYVDRHHLNFTVFLAQEYSPTNIHMNIYGINETINPLTYHAGINFGNPRISSLYLNVSDTIRYVKDHGGYITVNHYGLFTAEDPPYTLDQLRDWGVDGFEIVNMGDEVNKTITEYCLANNLICIGGSDSHEFNMLDTVVRLKLDDPENKSLDAVFQALKRNEHQVISIVNQSPEISGISAYFGGFGRYFISLNSFQRLYWWIWTFLGITPLIWVWNRVKRIIS